MGPRVVEQLARLNIHSVQDLLFHLPSQYQDRTHVTPLWQLRPGEHVMIEAEVVQVQEIFQPRRNLLCKLSDGGGQLSLRFFHYNKTQRLQLEQPGQRIRCYGEVRRRYQQGLEMIHPEYRLLNEQQTEEVATSLTPIYPATEGLQQLSLRKLTDQALKLLEQGALEDYLPTAVLQQFALSDLVTALHYVHRPPAAAPKPQLLEGKHPAQQRLALEELLAHHLSRQQLRLQWRQHQAPAFITAPDILQAFYAKLPFQLTGAQRRVIAEVTADLSQTQPMLRLVQGDVGSGKTVVAAVAMLQAVSNGYQAVLMAPTELLAEQHGNNLRPWFSQLGFEVINLTGTMKASEKRAALEKIASGEVRVIVGTHALLQKGVDYHRLALIVIDEQHRFGVNQRLELWQKGRQDQHVPHQLIMTATPIPRTLTMTAYADLDYSVIDELPPGRQPISTVVVSDQRRMDVIERIHEACQQGRQAYWVCTLIEESEVLQCQAAEVTALELTQLLPDLRIGLIHGRLKPADKEAIMQSFRRGEMDLLVATTVIEVGVDVPNASLMVIENPERLGLAQLHQLRGRVGRGRSLSHCVLLYHSPLGEIARKRLEVIKSSTDGFVIAQQDLELRGPGEVLGTRQAGLLQFKIADLVRDKELLPQVQDIGAQLLLHHPQSVSDLINRWLHQGEKYASV